MHRGWAATPIVCVLAWAVPAVAHDVAEPDQFETLLVTDELDDGPYLFGGYDIGDLYLAEAFDPQLGDGFYFHVQLFAPYQGDLGREWRVQLSFETPAGPVVRSMATTDGTNFESDFDGLRFKQSSESTDVQRAFLRYDPSKFSKGTTLRGFNVKSFVDGDLRDEAPGPLYAPGTGGAVPVPCVYPPPPCEGTSRVEQESFTLAGPDKYVHVRADPIPTGFRLEVRNLLKENGQHVHIDTGALDRQGRPGGWRGDVSEGTVELHGGETWKVDLAVEPVRGPDGSVAPLFMNVTTDIGGRVPLTVDLVEGRPALSVAGREAVLGGAPSPSGAAAGASWLLALAAVGPALLRGPFTAPHTRGRSR